MDKPYRILLADDEETLIKTTSELIKQQGWECDCVSSGDEVINMLEKGEYDVLIADRMMPGNEELELLEQVSEPYGIPTIVITGYPTMHSAIASIKQDAFDYVTKPIDTAYLLRRIREAAENQRLRKALSRMEEKYRTLIEDVFEVSHFGLIILDGTSKAAWANNTVEEYLGLKKEEIIGQSKEDLIHNKIKPLFEDAELFAQHALNIQKNPNASGSFICHLMGNDTVKERWIEYRSQAISHGPYEGGALEYFMDTTQRIQTEQEKRRIEIQFQESQKLESLGVLAGRIANDFNNQLSGILGGASLALMDLSPESPACEWLHKIEKSALRAADLCKQMLAYSGKSKLSIQQIDLNRLIKEMGYLIETSISKVIFIEYDFSENLPAIEADPTQIRQIILNLISNASEAIGPDHGTITIATGVKQCSKEDLCDSVFGETLPEGRYAYIRITDTGCGMTREVSKEIFSPFFTTKFSGRGLGLSAVMGIVRSHKGAIKIDSRPQEGATFTALFPATEPAPIPETAPTRVRGPMWRGDSKILIIDDEEIVRNITKSLLSNAGFTVLTARDGLEGIELVKKYTDQVDAILLDLTMPRMSGEEVYFELRRLAPATPIVLISGYNVENAKQRFPEKGLAGYLQKPFKPGELLDIISSVIQSENP